MYLFVFCKIFQHWLNSAGIWNKNLQNDLYDMKFCELNVYYQVILRSTKLYTQN